MPNILWENRGKNYFKKTAAIYCILTDYQSVHGTDTSVAQNALVKAPAISLSSLSGLLIALHSCLNNLLNSSVSIKV